MSGTVEHGGDRVGRGEEARNRLATGAEVAGCSVVGTGSFRAKLLENNFFRSLILESRRGFSVGFLRVDVGKALTCPLFTLVLSGWKTRFVFAFTKLWPGQSSFFHQLLLPCFNVFIILLFILSRSGSGVRGHVYHEKSWAIQQSDWSISPI